MTTISELAAVDPDLVVAERLRFYPAGLISEASQWRKFAARAAEHGIVNVASWIALDDAEPEGITQAQFAEAWVGNISELRSADVLVINALDPRPLRGAVFEAGYALGIGRLVIVIGDRACYSSWQYHPLIIRLPDMDAAMEMLLFMASQR